VWDGGGGGKRGCYTSRKKYFVTLQARRGRVCVQAGLLQFEKNDRKHFYIASAKREREEFLQFFKNLCVKLPKKRSFQNFRNSAKFFANTFTKGFEKCYKGVGVGGGSQALVLQVTLVFWSLQRCGRGEHADLIVALHILRDINKESIYLVRRSRNMTRSEKFGRKKTQG
jgi:hypothetical protein